MASAFGGQRSIQLSYGCMKVAYTPEARPVQPGLVCSQQRHGAKAVCLRLMEGADIYQIATNCRTSVEMIEKYYAVHIRTTLDIAAINVRRERPPKSKGHRRPEPDSPSQD